MQNNKAKIKLLPLAQSCCFLASLCTCMLFSMFLKAFFDISEISFQTPSTFDTATQTRLVTASQRRKKMFSVQYVMSTNVPIRSDCLS